jgi:hypothetical protein
MGKIRKMGTSRPLIGREAWGRGLPAQPAGGRFQKYFEARPESLFANKKSFLFAKRSLRHASCPASGREVLLYYFCYILLVGIVIFCWNL